MMEIKPWYKKNPKQEAILELDAALQKLGDRSWRPHWYNDHFVAIAFDIPPSLT